MGSVLGAGEGGWGGFSGSRTDLMLLYGGCGLIQETLEGKFPSWDLKVERNLIVSPR